MNESERVPANRAARAVAVAALGLAAMLGFAACSPAPASIAPTTSSTSGAPTTGATPTSVAPGASTATATVTVSAMATSLGEVPDFCQGASGQYNDVPNHYSFTITVKAPGGADATDQDAPALLGKVAHLTLVGPPDAGTYDEAIVHGPGGAGLSLIFTGVRCEPAGFSTLGDLLIDALPLTVQSDGTRTGTLSIP